MDIKSHKICVFGIQESGKTYFAQHGLAPQYDNPLIFVVNKDDVPGWIEVKNAHVYLAENRLNVGVEFKKFMEAARKWALEGKIDAIFIDEADLFFNSNYDLDPVTLDLVLNHRHIPENKGTALIFMTRRPQDIPTKIVESSKFLFIFKLEGANAIQRFKEINPTIPPLIEALDYKRYNFVVKEIGKDAYIHKPL